MKQTWVILGASSAIARAFARRMADRNADLFLCGRDKTDIVRIAADLSIRGDGEAKALPFDAAAPASFGSIIEAMAEKDGQLNIAVFAGYMPSQERVDADPALLQDVTQANFTGLAHFIHLASSLLEMRESGVIIGVGSVAGDRGRLGNYVYGAAKAGFHTYLSGLRNRLGRKGIQVLTVKPGFVDTNMTWGQEGMFLVASPDEIATSIERGIQRKRNTIYSPWFWFGIMSIIKVIPEMLFKKLII